MERKEYQIVKLLAIITSLWIIGWWPIYGLVWLTVGWKYLVFILKAKIGIVLFSAASIILFEATKELFYYFRRKRIKIYIVAVNSSN